MRPGGAVDYEGVKTKTEIRNYMSKLCIEGMEILQEIHPEAINKQGILNQLFLLPTGIHLDPDPTRAKEYNSTDAVLLFAAMGIPLVHGHATEEEEAANSLTDYGIYSLLECLKDDALAVLYLNGHYSVVLKKDNILLTLQNQESILTNLPDAIWKRLTVKDDDSFYLTSRFSPTKKQPNMEEAENWYHGNLKEKFGDSGGSIREDKQKKARSLKRRIFVDESVSASTAEENALDPPAVGESSNELPLFVEKEIEPSEIGPKFLTFLLEFKICGHEKCYFDCIFQSILYLGKPYMCIPYELIKTYDNNLAVAIRDQYPRVKSDLKISFVKYLEHHRFSMPNLEEAAMIDILDLPKPKSTQCLEEFVRDHKMTEEYELYGGVVKNSTACDGRRMAAGYLDDILRNFEANKCYRGEWKVSDMKVKDQLNFFIDKEAEYQLTRAHGIDDLLHYCLVVFPFFRDKNGELPLFFDELQAECMRMPEPGTPEWKKFVKLIRSALALKAPTVRSTLLCDIYKLASVKMLSGRPYTPLNNKKCLVEWRENLKTLKPFKWIYEFNNGDGIYVIDKWCCTYWFLLKFSRNFIEHVLEHLKKELTLHNLIVVELMLSYQLRKFLAEFIRYFVYNCDIEGSFHSAWSHYEASDCMDKPTIDASKGAFIQPQDNTELIAAGDINLLLHQVCSGSSIACLNILIKAGADVNSKIHGSPLHAAAKSGNREIITLLLEAGGKANACDDDGLMPIEVAAFRTNYEAVEVLFPFTSPIPSIPNWSPDGIKEYSLSKVFQDQPETGTTEESTSEVASHGEVELERITSAESPNIVTSHTELSCDAKDKYSKARSRGDNYFKSKDYIGAVNAYTEAIELDPSDYVVWSNRSICWLMVGIPENSLADAKHCQHLKPDYPTALYREGAALHMLEKYYEAAYAFFKGAQVAPEDNFFIKGFRDAVQAGRKRDGVEVMLDKVEV